MQKLSRIKQSIYEASIRDLHLDPLGYLYKNFIVHLKDGRFAKYPLMLIFFAYVFILFPSLKDKLCNKDYWKNLPFALDIDSIQDVTDGNSKLVFKINLNNGKSYVLKFNKSSIGINPDDIIEICTVDKSEYETVKEWYKGLDIVHPTNYLVMNSPVAMLPAAVSVQEFVEGNLVDIFDYLECPEDIVEIARTQPNFALQLYGFAERTLDLYFNHNRSIDLIGRRNVALSFTDFGVDLKILDAECIIFYFDNGEIPGPEMVIIKRKMDFLLQIKEMLLQLPIFQEVVYRES